MKFTDQLGRTIEIDRTPKRIISLVPSQTELLYDLGLDEEVIGITKFCVHPEHWFRNKTRIGGTKTVNINKIKELQPDLIIANKEENVKEQVDELAKHFPVFVTDVNSLDDAYQMIYHIGKLTGKESKSEQIIKQINEGFSQLQTSNKLQTAYLIWKDPFMTIGGDTFVDDMLYYAGAVNIFSDKSRYPEITIKDLQDRGCQLLLLSSEPYPFSQKHVDELQSHLPTTKILLVDGEMFSWYGSRLLKAPSYFQKLGEKLLPKSHKSTN